MNELEQRLLNSVRKGDLKSVERQLHVRAEIPETVVIGALSAAAELGFIEIVEAILDDKMDPNTPDSNGMTSLMFACRSGQTQVATMLLRRGASLEAVDQIGWTALFYAAFEQHAETVAHLLQAGAKVSHHDAAGRTCLHCARLVTLINIRVPTWVPLVGDIMVAGGQLPLRRSSPTITALEGGA